MLDNLRRTLSAPACLAVLLASWALSGGAALLWTTFILATLALPAVIPAVAAIVPRRAGITSRSHLRALARDLSLSAQQLGLQLAFLPHQAWLMFDAIGRSLFRLFISRRRLLEWVTAAQASLSARPGLLASCRSMLAGSAITLLIAAFIGAAGNSAVWLMVPFVLLWLASPAIAFWISRAPRLATHLTVSDADARSLRQIARRTWRYFETFVTAEDHMLPPDNFQEDPLPVLAHRTSPTNLGLYLLSIVSARDFGWLGTVEAAERLTATLATMSRLQRYRGHFYNWYDTRDLRALEPRYVSSVDSGNLAAHLIAVANAAREWATSPMTAEQVAAGALDALSLAQQALRDLPVQQRCTASDQYSRSA
jgi:cyclic beta-1,2-glucan synthetase